MCDFVGLLDGRPDCVLSLNLLCMPDELLEMILKNLNYDEISRTRLVCKKFDLCCQRLLNQGFIMVERFHGQCLRDIKAQLPRRESERRDHPLARHSDILTAIETRLSLLSMTFMKYVDMSLCCFIPGKVIDEIFRVLRYVQCTSCPPRSHEILQELRDISSMAMEHFDENIVPLLKQKIGTSSRSSSIGSSNAAAVSPVRPLQVACAGGAVRRELTKLQLWVRHLTTSTNCMKKELVDNKEKLVEYKKKLQEQDKRIIEQNQVIAEQCTRISEQDNKICEMNRKVLECERRLSTVFAGLDTSGNSQPKRNDVRLVADPVARSSKTIATNNSDETVASSSGTTQPSGRKPQKKDQGKRKLEEGKWNCNDCCKRKKGSKLK